MKISCNNVYCLFDAQCTRNYIYFMKISWISMFIIKAHICFLGAPRVWQWQLSAVKKHSLDRSLSVFVLFWRETNNENQTYIVNHMYSFSQTFKPILRYVQTCYCILFHAHEHEKPRRESRYIQRFFSFLFFFAVFFPL